MFSTEDAPADGVSAVKAIALAAAEGQRIYTITADNVEQALAQINISAATEQEIRNAAYSGKIITTHQHQINFHGWIGEGYIIIDPTTGAGAYKIAGGGNGGFIFLTFVSALLTILGLFFLSAGILPIITGLFLGVGAHLFIGSVIVLILTGRLSLFEISFYRAAISAIALILIGTEVAVTVALGSVLGFIVSMIAELIK